MTSKYIGHLPNSGGLQGHSIGGTYPIGVYAQNVNFVTKWGVMNFCTGEVLSFGFDKCSTAHSAARAHNAGFRNSANKQATLRAIITNGGHHA
jgi:hypothetical protein